MTAEIVARRELHRGWLTLTEATVRLADGTELKREVEAHGRAAAVLPFDAQRRTAILVRLLRAPPLMAGVPAGELLEAPAGILDAGEHAEAAARREVLEETGLRLEALEHVVTAWPMPGVSTETIALYLAPYTEASRVAPGGGLAAEHENITVVEMRLATLWELAERGELVDMKTLTLLLALRTRRPELFG